MRGTSYHFGRFRAGGSIFAEICAVVSTSSKYFPGEDSKSVCFPAPHIIIELVGVER